jgi:cbb3-type cytochrome oxidase maturation protein
MSVLMLLIFISLVLAGLAVALFVWSVGNEDFDHAAQLSLKPLEDEP